MKGKGNMRTYFLCGKDGFDKELPFMDEGEYDSMHMRESVNSMASIVSSASSSTCPSETPTPKTSNVSTATADFDDRYKSKQTSILEVTCL